METLMIFSQSIKSLTDTQFDELMTTLNSSLDRTKKTHLLFNALYRDLIDNKTNNITQINQILAEIHQKERIKSTINDANDTNDDDEDIDIEPIKMMLDDLPSVIFAKIASFLQFQDGLNFEMVNRSIFIGSRTSKSPIHSIHDNDFRKLLKFCHENKNQNLPKFRRYKSLTMNVSDTMEYDEWNTFDLFNHIETLQIVFEENINDILCRLSKITNIKTLQLIQPDGCYENDNYIKLLSQIIERQINLKYFELSIDFDENIIFTDYQWITKLKGIAIHNLRYDSIAINMKKGIYSAIGNNLESLHKGDDAIINEMNGKWNQLKEICLIYPSEADIDILLKQNWINLQRIQFRHYGSGIYNEDDEYIETMQLWINKIMSRIEYIAFDATDNSTASIQQIIDILIKSLQNIQKKKRLKIRMNELKLDEYENNIEIIGKLQQLTNWLDARCSNWMLICCNLKITKSRDELHDILESMKKEYNVTLNKKVIIGWCSKQGHTYSDIYNFVINNNDCNICGYHEKWIMQCSKCPQHAMFD